jgi:hypothetical protein
VCFLRADTIHSRFITNSIQAHRHRPHAWLMSETPSSEPATGPVATATEPAAAPPPAYVEPQRHSRLTAVAAWVGIVAGVVFIVAVIFFSGFFLGAHSGGGHRGGHHPGGEVAIFHKGGPPPMFPMGPRGEFERPGPGFQPPFGPGGPNFQGPQGPGSQQPSAPSTTAPARP